VAQAAILHIVSDVFLSYSRLDREFALRLHAALVARGKDVWVDEEDIPPTARWREELRAAIETADSFVFLISPGRRHHQRRAVQP
jgi:TIR domain